MDTSIPRSAASRFGDFRSAMIAFVEAAKSASADGLTWSEFGDLLISLLRLGIWMADELKWISGPNRKELVLEAVAALFDAVADKAVPAYLWPLWLVVKPSIRSLILAMASGAIESLLPYIRKAQSA